MGQAILALGIETAALTEDSGCTIGMKEGNDILHSHGWGCKFPQSVNGILDGREASGVVEAGDIEEFSNSADISAIEMRSWTMR
jgi:hypothetical protein